MNDRMSEAVTEAAIAQEIHVLENVMTIVTETGGEIIIDLVLACCLVGFWYEASYKRGFKGTRPSSSYAQ